MKMILSDGTELDNLELNGNNYVSKAEVTEDLFNGNLATVTIESDEGTQELNNCKLVHLEQDGDEWHFIIDEMSQAEIDKNNSDAQIMYTALMTDTLIEEV